MSSSEDSFGGLRGSSAAVSPAIAYSQHLSCRRVRHMRVYRDVYIPQGATGHPALVLDKAAARA